MASAPARVNIIGEHTDYNDGFVLPSCTALFTRVTATARADSEVHVHSSMHDNTASFELGQIAPSLSGEWSEYIKGVAAGLWEAGIELPGADVVIDGNIPLGAGLSSSASLELAVASALLRLAGATMSASDLALLCQKAEHDYAGVRCGIMDQYAVACAEYGHALLLDCRSMEAAQVQLPDELALVLTDSGVRHKLVDGNYNERAAECEQAVSILAGTDASIVSLRDADEDLLTQCKDALGDKLYRRCRHVVTENQRVSHIVDALGAGDLEQVGRLLSASHLSLSQDYEVSRLQVDQVVAAANTVAGVLGSRMVGGGFGGCVLSVCRQDDVAAAAAQIRSGFASVIDTEPWQHIVAPAHPVRSRTVE